MTKICRCCGAEFDTAGNVQYCSDKCRKAILRKRAAAYKSSPNPKGPKEPPKPPDKSLSLVVAEAKAAGMSYGRYVAAMKEAKRK